MTSHQVSILARFKVIYSINRSSNSSRTVVLSCSINAHYRFGLKYDPCRAEAYSGRHAVRQASAIAESKRKIARTQIKQSDLLHFIYIIKFI